MNVRLAIKMVSWGCKPVVRINKAFVSRHSENSSRFVKWQLVL